jgi:invasion protein IalB
MKIASPRWIALGFVLASASVAAAQQNGAPPRRPAAPPPAQAAPASPPPVSTTPQVTTATYGDWVLRCQTTDDAQAKHLCEVAETIQVEGKGPIAQIAFGRVPGKPPLLMTVVLPTNITLPSSVLISTDDKDTQPAELSWLRCVPAGCIANVEIKDDILRRWRPLTTQGRLQFKEGDGRDVILPFSFRGLSQALDALGKA